MGAGVRHELTKDFGRLFSTVVSKPSVIDGPPEIRRPRAFFSNARGGSTFPVDSAFGDDADGRDAIAIRLDPRILGRLLGLGPRGIL